MRTRISIVLMPMLTLVLFCGGEPENEGSVRDQVVAASRGYRGEDGSSRTTGSGTFGATGFAGAFYGGDWTVADPFTDATKFYLGPSLLSHSYPYDDTDQALARSERSEQQVFIVAGSDPTLEKRLEEKTREYASARVTGFPEELVTADGETLEYRIYHVRPGVLAGEEMLLEVAFAEKRGTLVLLDAGLSYGRPPAGTVLGDPRSHATLPMLVPELRVGELFER